MNTPTIMILFIKKKTYDRWTHKNTFFLQSKASKYDQRPRTDHEQGFMTLSNSEKNDVSSNM